MYMLFKRLFDLLSSLIVLIIISPLFIFIMVLVKIIMGDNVFFKQVRSGYCQRPFSIIKFRTMTNQMDEKGELLPDELRQTKFGSFLRSTSLDELPELITIIKGNMSVVGPRPLPIEYDDYYTEKEKKRFNVRPGLIPPDSIYGGVDLTWDEQLACEAEYAEKICLKKDIKVFLSVFKTLLNRKKGNYGNTIRMTLTDERKKTNI